MQATTTKIRYTGRCPDDTGVYDPYTLDSDSVHLCVVVDEDGTLCYHTPHSHHDEYRGPDDTRMDVTGLDPDTLRQWVDVHAGTLRQWATTPDHTDRSSILGDSRWVTGPRSIAASAGVKYLAHAADIEGQILDAGGIEAWVEEHGTPAEWCLEGMAPGLTAIDDTTPQDLIDAMQAWAVDQGLDLVGVDHA